MEHLRSLDSGSLDIDGHFVAWNIFEATDGVTFWWSDGVANEWTEDYPNIALAFARLGMLIAAVKQGELYAMTREELLAQFYGTVC